ncbi:hypothetical protein CY91_01475 [Dehalococcoides mccartyi]|uniref:Glycerol-3-phosphate acyltransferase n=2 Tax=Dehalococcoides mccartyi TaxID=61435 RepID=A0A328EM94_9CHLR|nr:MULTISPECIES: glycerol-3-phosphate acyltransferase [Dehalococcoides]AGG06509.1 glycerol-3-phosphate acyltransferase [Dehalococcoides mccartyi DCMB5]AGG07999.1 glycerol-3-phosphate acyltransferase [Dehalococcoides mccartyi BTF08]AQW62530.1 hypothetical protein B1779_04445 [Dehalococcoides mccartyi]AQX74696.1 hypothetical protein B1776_03865 [Dehalococcoides mccartyi]AQY73273.1 hypothetical protein B1772_04175 [Dehalococcoides mccartyi]
MNSLIMVIIALIAAYFIGSTPAPYLAGRIFKKIDIRTVGSKNMGSMNVFYNVGFWPGILVLTVDIGKGALAMAVANWLGEGLGIQMLCALMAIAGHNYPVWLKFKGGKGGATAIGILAYMMPEGIPIYIACFLILMAITRFPTLSYGISFISFILVAWLGQHDMGKVLFSLLVVMIPILMYIPRMKEIKNKAGSGNAKRAIFRRNLKERL